MRVGFSSEDLAKLPILEGVPQQELELLRPCFALVRFKEGEQVLREGEDNDRLLCTLSGRLQVWRQGEPSDLLLTEIREGEVIGELTFLEPGPATATVTAMEAGEAITLSASAVQELEVTHPTAAIALYRSLAITLKRRLADATTQLMAHRGVQEALREVEELRYSLVTLL